MARYKYSGSGVYDNDNGWFIPNDPGNRHWQEYLAYDGTTDPEFTPQEIEDNAWAELRGERDRLLNATDFMMTQDFYTDKMTVQEQTDVKTYREALRDLPDNTPDPTSVTWPTKPQIVIDNGI